MKSFFLYKLNSNFYSQIHRIIERTVFDFEIPLFKLHIRLQNSDKCTAQTAQNKSPFHTHNFADFPNHAPFEKMPKVLTVLRTIVSGSHEHTSCITVKQWDFHLAIVVKETRAFVDRPGCCWRTQHNIIIQYEFQHDLNN